MVLLFDRVLICRYCHRDSEYEIRPLMSFEIRLDPVVRSARERERPWSPRASKKKDRHNFVVWKCSGTNGLRLYPPSEILKSSFCSLQKELPTQLERPAKFTNSFRPFNRCACPLLFSIKLRYLLVWGKSTASAPITLNGDDVS